MMAIAGIILVAKWLAKIKHRSDVRCRLCKRAREQRGASTKNLQEGTYGHINSAFCDGMATNDLLDNTTTPLSSMLTVLFALCFQGMVTTTWCCLADITTVC